MEEQLFYIEENIAGVWDNERYSLIVNPKNENGQRLLSLTNKESAPNTGYGLIGYINKKEFDYVLTMVDTLNRPMIAKDYKINLDAAHGKLILSSDGVSWDFKKVA